MQSKDIKDITTIQAAFRSFLARKNYGINHLRKEKLEDYPVLIVGNDPTITKLPNHNGKDTIALLGTSGMRSIELAYRLNADTTKLIIIDNSRQVTAFWRKAREIMEKSQDTNSFLDTLKCYVEGSKCNQGIHTKNEFTSLGLFGQNCDFDRLKKITTGTTVIGQSWSDKEVILNIKNILEDNSNGDGIKNIYAYLSNIVAYVNEESSIEAEKILQNVQELNPIMAIHTDYVTELAGSKPKNFFLITDHTPENVKKTLNIDSDTSEMEKLMSLLKVFTEPAQQVAEKKAEDPEPTAPTFSSFKKGFFDKDKELELIIKKYKLPDASQSSLEKALRTAANNNYKKELEILITHVKNINAQDTNEKSKKTALHWAAIKGHRECYELLIAAGADPKILDAQQRTAESYYQEKNNIVVNN
jgi:hypothetical protein